MDAGSYAGPGWLAAGWGTLVDDVQSVWMSQHLTLRDDRRPAAAIRIRASPPASLHLPPACRQVDAAPRHAGQPRLGLPLRGAAGRRRGGHPGRR